MISTLVISFCIALGITIYVSSLLKPVASHLGLIDKPGGRKNHQGEIPLVGGIAMFLGFFFTLLTLPISLAPFRSLIAALALLMIMGVLDDLHEIKPYARLVAQAIASILMLLCGTTLSGQLGNIFGTGNLSITWPMIPFTLLVVIASVNAMNMLDGCDGLLGSLSLLILGTLSYFCLVGGFAQEQSMILTLIACVLGYLFYNFPFQKNSRARIFMGDSGSMFLGFCLIWFLVYLNKQAPVLINLAILMWILALPIFDIVNVTLRRILQKKNPLHASNDHIHHWFLQQGFSNRQMLFSLIFICFCTQIIAILGSYFEIPAFYLFYAFLTVFIVASFYYHKSWSQLGLSYAV